MEVSGKVHGIQWIYQGSGTEVSTGGIRGEITWRYWRGVTTGYRGWDYWDGVCDKGGV